jgi:type I restriction enzyme S subunit
MGVMLGHRPTEAGVLPDEWPVFAIGSLGAGSTPPIKAGPFGSALTKDIYVPEGYKVYGQEQVIRGDHRYGDYFVTAKKYRELESCAVRPGDRRPLVGTSSWCPTGSSSASDYHARSSVSALGRHGYRLADFFSSRFESA